MEELRQKGHDRSWKNYVLPEGKKYNFQGGGGGGGVKYGFWTIDPC